MTQRIEWADPIPVNILVPEIPLKGSRLPEAPIHIGRLADGTFLSVADIQLQGESLYSYAVATSPSPRVWDRKNAISYLEESKKANHDVHKLTDECAGSGFDRESATIQTSLEAPEGELKDLMSLLRKIHGETSAQTRMLDYISEATADTLVLKRQRGIPAHRWRFHRYLIDVLKAHSVAAGEYKPRRNDRKKYRDIFLSKDEVTRRTILNTALETMNAEQRIGLLRQFMHTTEKENTVVSTDQKCWFLPRDIRFKTYPLISHHGYQKYSITLSEGLRANFEDTGTGRVSFGRQDVKAQNGLFPTLRWSSEAQGRQLVLPIDKAILDQINRRLQRHEADSKLSRYQLSPTVGLMFIQKLLNIPGKLPEDMVNPEDFGSGYAFRSTWEVKDKIVQSSFFDSAELYWRRSQDRKLDVD
jgi:hypothetical protein